MRQVVIPLRHSRWAVWSALFAAGLAYEFYEISEGPAGLPLTKVIREVFHTDTPAGRALFVLAVEQGSAWLIRHITEGTTTT